MPYSTRQEVGLPVKIKDEGLTLVNNANSIDFAGSGVSGSVIGTAVTEVIPGNDVSAVWGSISGTLSDQTDLSSSLDAKVPYSGATTNVTLGVYTLTTPKVIGGAALSSDLTLQTTSGVGATGADMHFKVGNNGATEAMTILNSGYVGIGTTSPVVKLHLSVDGTTPHSSIYNSTNDVMILTNQEAAAQFRLVTADNDTAVQPSQFILHRSRGTIATPAAVVNGDRLGTFVVGASDTATTRASAAMISVDVDNTVSSGVMPAAISFTTYPAGAALERMRITSAGLVGIGTISPDVRNGQLLDVAATANYGGASLSSWNTTAAYAPILDLKRSKHATIGTHTVVAADDALGYIVFRGSDGSAFKDAAYIKGSVDGTPGSNDMPGRLQFFTTPDGTASSLERMRITKDGYVGVNITPTHRFSISNNATNTDTSAVDSDSILRLLSNDSTNCRVTLVSSGGSPIYGGVRLNGTTASPTAAVADNALVFLGGYGYNGTAYVGNRGNVTIAAAETWTSTNQGTYMTLNTTTAGATTVSERLRIDSVGNIGIRVTVPTAYLHLAAGTATASTAPLKFNSGTLNTTAEAGAMEFLTDMLYFTITTSAARKQIPLIPTDAALTIAAAKTISSSVNTTVMGNDVTLVGSGTNQYEFPSVSDTLMGLADVQTVTGAKTFSDTKLIMAGATSGTTTLKATAVAGTTTITFPATTGTVALLDSPTFTGTPAAPTAAVDTNTTQIATTAFVIGQGYSKANTMYGEMYQYENATATVIGTTDVYHAVDSMVTGVVNGITFTAGLSGAIASVADYSGTVAGTVLITDVAHGLATGDIVTIHSTTDYNGTFSITKVTNDTFYITETYTSSQTGDWHMGSYLKVGTTGVYRISMSHTSHAASANKVFKFEMNKNLTPLDNIVVSNKFGTTDYTPMNASGLVSLTANDRIWCSVKNQTDATDITVRHANINITRA